MIRGVCKDLAKLYQARVYLYLISAELCHDLDGLCQSEGDKLNNVVIS